MKTFAEIDTTGVTDEQIGRCHKIYEGSQPVWMVESESDPDKEYKVRWSRQMGFTCQCPAGEHGFARCKDGYCKHVRWSCAAEKELRQAMCELQAAMCVPSQPVKPVATVTSVDAETLARVQAASQKPTKASRAKGYQPRAFSILK